MTLKLEDIEFHLLSAIQHNQDAVVTSHLQAARLGLQAIMAKRITQTASAPTGYCERAGGCVCGGDLPRVREGCSEWVKPAPAPADERAARHINDDTPQDAVCEAALAKIDAKTSQGVDPFWAWGYRKGWHEARAASANETGADGAEPVTEGTPKDRARWFVRDFSRNVGFAMSDAQQEVMLNLFLKYAGRSPAMAAEAAKSVATVRVKHGGYAMELSTHVAYALPEGMHELYAAPQPPAQADARELTDEQIVRAWAAHVGEDAAIVDAQGLIVPFVRAILKGANHD